MQPSPEATPASVAVPKKQVPHRPSIWQRLSERVKASRLLKRGTERESFYTAAEIAKILASGKHHVAELYRGVEKRVRQIEKHTPSDVLLPSVPTLYHDTKTRDDVIKVLTDGLQVQNFGLQTPVGELVPQGTTQQENDEVRKRNTSRLANGGIQGNNFAVIMSFPENTPPDVRAAYDKIVSTRNTWMDNWEEMISQGLGKGEALAFLPSQYMTGVVDTNTGQYFTSEQFLKT